MKSIIEDPVFLTALLLVWAAVLSACGYLVGNARGYDEREKLRSELAASEQLHKWRERP